MSETVACKMCIGVDEGAANGDPASVALKIGELTHLVPEPFATELILILRKGIPRPKSGADAIRDGLRAMCHMAAAEKIFFLANPMALPGTLTIVVNTPELVGALTDITNGAEQEHVNGKE